MTPVASDVSVFYKDVRSQTPSRRSTRDRPPAHRTPCPTPPLAVRLVCTVFHWPGLQIKSFDVRFWAVYVFGTFVSFVLTLLRSSRDCSTLDIGACDPNSEAPAPAMAIAHRSADARFEWNGTICSAGLQTPLLTAPTKKEQ